MTRMHRRPWGKILASFTGMAMVATVANVAVADETPPADPATGISGSAVKIPIPPDAKYRGGLDKASGPVTVFVQFTGQGAFDATQPQAVKEGRQEPIDKSAEVKRKRRAINDVASSVAGEAGASRKLYVTTNTIPGVAITADADSVRKLAHRADVVKIAPIVPKKYDNKGTDIDTKALNAWTQNHATGEGATIAVLDTGVDYTHADFGGPGTVEAYKKAQASDSLPAPDSGLLDPNKFIGGHDLVGDDYNADPSSSTYQPVPHPDDNPLDCAAAGHGTHVAGTAAGYGVAADGKTFKGDYGKLDADAVDKMKIGPGSAPESKLVSLRVFGCEGSSSVVGQALDYVLDPNADGKFDDRANVVNMSLGSDWSPTDDPENDIVDKLTKQGVLSVVASGNAGDIYDIGGSPGNARSALTVANSVGSTAALDRIDVVAPADKAGQVAGQYSADYDYTGADPAELSGTVTYAPDSNPTGCTAFSADDAKKIAGKWVMLEWDDDDATRECGSATRFDNAAQAGATAVVLTSTLAWFTAGIAGNATIPGVQLNRSATDSLTPAAKAGELELELDPDYQGAATVASGGLDTLNASSSRGVHGSNGIVKPDVAAPGTSIASAHVGSGNGIAVKSGTSMATPHVAGIAALLYAQNDTTPYEVKTTIMNTANVDVLAGKTAYGPNRVGSGRVDALAATTDHVTAHASDDPVLTSVNFGVVEVGDKPVSISKKITIASRAKDTKTFEATYVPATEMPGVTYSVSAPTVTVGGGGTAEITVTMSIDDPKALAKTLDPTMSRTQLGVPRQYIADASGRVQLTSSSNPTLRVPVYAAPKPTSAMSADASVAFATGSTETALKLNGRGLNQGGEGQNYTSLVAPLVLGATSPQLPESADAPITNKSMDLQYVGASSTVPAVAAAKGDPAEDGVVSFGVSTYGNWPSLMALSAIGVDIDINDDGKPDFRMSTGVAAGLDAVLVDTTDLATGKLVDERPANGVWGDLDTNTMDTNTMTLQVSARALGLDLSKPAPISYKVFTYSDYSINDGGENVPVDQTDSISFDVSNPALWFSGDKPAALFVDAPGSAITVHRAAESRNASALLLHLHNATTAKSQIVLTENQ